MEHETRSESDAPCSAGAADEGASTPRKHSHAPTIESAVAITCVAARRAAQLFDMPVLSSRKSDGSLLTAADREIEDILHTGLSNIQPDAYFFGEESLPENAVALSEMLQRPLVWAVDAVDGTCNFHSGLPLFAVSVGLLQVERSRLHPRVGIVAFPRLNQVFFVEQGMVYRRSLEGTDEVIIPRPCATENPVSSGITYVQGLSINREGVKHIRLTGCNAFDIVYAALRGQGTSTRGALWDFSGALAIGAAFGMEMRECSSGERPDGFALSDFDPISWRLKKRHIISYPGQFDSLRRLFHIQQ